MSKAQLYTCTFLRSYACIHIHLLPFSSHAKQTDSAAEGRAAEREAISAGKGMLWRGYIYTHSSEISLSGLITCHGSWKHTERWRNGNSGALLPFTSGAWSSGSIHASQLGPDQSTAHSTPHQVRHTTTCTRFTASIMNERNILK